MAVDTAVAPPPRPGGGAGGVAAGGGSAVLDTGDSEHPRDSGGEASSELEPITGTSEAEAG